MAIASYRIFGVMARPGAMCIEDDLAAVIFPDRSPKTSPHKVRSGPGSTGVSDGKIKTFFLKDHHSLAQTPGPDLA